MYQIAAVAANTTVYYAEYNPASLEPNSAATQLIQGIYENYPLQALQILRNKIYLNYLPSLLCRGMIAIAAKRYGVDPNLNRLTLLSHFKDVNEPPIKISFKAKAIDSEVNYQDLSSLIQWLKMSDEPQSPSLAPPPLYQRHRSIRTALLDSHKNIIAMAQNGNSMNKTLHAEVILLQNYYQQYLRGFHEPVTLLTSLQCCKMCAAMVWTMHSDPWNQLEVVYLRPETGSSALDTILRANSNLRREFANSPQSISKQIEFIFENSRFACDPK